MLYLVKYIQYLVVLGIAAGVCYIVLTPIHMPIFAQIILKILLCSIICNIIFYIIFRKTQEFQKVKEIGKNVFSILLWRK